MDWTVVAGTTIAAIVGGLLALAGGVVVDVRRRKNAEIDEAQIAGRQFITWLVAYLVTFEDAGLAKASERDLATPLLEAITRFRLAPVFSRETLACGEKFHDAINEDVHFPPDSEHDKQRRNLDRLLLQREFEALVRRDLGRPIPGPDSNENQD